MTPTEGWALVIALLGAFAILIACIRRGQRIQWKRVAVAALALAVGALWLWLVSIHGVGWVIRWWLFIAAFSAVFIGIHYAIRGLRERAWQRKREEQYATEWVRVHRAGRLVDEAWDKP